MNIGTRIKDEDGRLGIVVDNFMGACDQDEIPVVFDGVTYFEGVDEATLTDLGIPDHKPGHEKCGAGQGDDCCIFLTVGKDGLACERFGGLRNTLIFKTMSAKRHPAEPYPDCMSQ